MSVTLRLVRFVEDLLTDQPRRFAVGCYGGEKQPSDVCLRSMITITQRHS